MPVGAVDHLDGVIGFWLDSAATVEEDIDDPSDPDVFHTWLASFTATDYVVSPAAGDLAFMYRRGRVWPPGKQAYDV